MNYPPFYDEIPTITLQDSLSEFLGAFEEGIIEFSYLDIVKSAGHSCPTVLGAYLMAQQALKRLYEDEIPKRGDIKIAFKEDANEGVAGVIANVIQHITGATQLNGFKGIAGHFDRRHLMSFNANISSMARFTRRDTNKSVEVVYLPSKVLPHEEMSELMQKCIAKKATEAEQKRFGELWQKRVESISQRVDEVIEVFEL